MKTIAIAAALAGLTLAGGAQAAGPVNARQLNQERRIDAGVRSGKLTHREAARLRTQQDRIERDAAYRRAAHGGHLTHHDKQMIHARQDAANARILKQKDNGRRGPDKLPFH